MYFISTRGEEKVTGAQAVVQGIAGDGGLFVPEVFPTVPPEEIERMCEMDYAERAAYLLSKFFDEFEEDGLLEACRAAYRRFEGNDAAPLLRMDNGMYMLELFHGPTCAFKDVALTLMPYLLKKSCEKAGVKEKILILTATSGDTGKAALEGFKDQEGVKICVFYPEEGVSKMQKLQMCTTEGNNIDVVAVRGNFDDCQRAVKNIMNSAEKREEISKRGYILSSANSINIGRLLPQVVYYFSAYCDLLSSDQLKMGEKVVFAVPTGNFGNILAGYYAERMGLPVETLVCASNKNCALTDLLKTGTYNVKRPFFRTMSPSMDILISSNLERLIFELSGRNAELTASRMQSLSVSEKYSLRAEELKELKSLIYAGCTNESDTVETIYDFFMDYGYPMDPHTGVAMSVAQRYEAMIEEDKDAEKHPIIVLSTASPYKFPQDILYALTGNDVKDSYKGVKRIHLLTAMKVPECLKEIRYKPILFKTVVSCDKMYDEVLKFIN